MMLPLCTSVTLRRPARNACEMASRTRRSVPSRDTGLIPMPLLPGKRMFLTPMSFWRKAMIFFASGLSAAHSIPA